MIYNLEKKSKTKLNLSSIKNILTIRYDITKNPTKKLAVVKDFENWASSMSPMKHPNGMSIRELMQHESFLKNTPHKFDSYRGTKTYSNLYQGGDKDARYD